MQDLSVGALYILSAPSGAGKTTVSSRLRAAGCIRVSVSHTTRPPRSSEKEGDSYFFVERREFEAMREDGEFLEWAEVYGHLYGTSKRWVDEQLAAGEKILLEIDCQGARQIKQKKPNATAIFLSPPDMETLKTRLEARQTDDAETIARRLKWAEAEMRQKKHFDYVIINSCLDDAVQRIRSIIEFPPTIKGE